MDFWKYSRQATLAHIGQEGQEKIEGGNVCVVGLGGLGSNVAMSLAAAGVGHIRIVDHDVVSLPDLHRQLLYRPQDVGFAKVDAAKRRLTELNPDVNVDAVCAHVGSSYTPPLSGTDVIVDCLDNFAARYRLHRAAAAAGLPVVHGSALEYYGTASSFLPSGSPCFECLYPSMSDAGAPTCAQVGVLPQTVLAVSSIQAAETLGFLTGKPNLIGKLLFIDFADMTFDRVTLSENPECPRKKGLVLPDEAYESEPEYACSRDGRETYALYIDNPPIFEDVLARAAKRFQTCSRKGENALMFSEGGSDYFYTSAGYLLSMVKPTDKTGLADPRSDILKIAKEISRVTNQMVEN
ncbi:MAG: HesA/MoeB/ThiF family protein [Thermoprotei archaeon]